MLKTEVEPFIVKIDNGIIQVWPNTHFLYKQ